MIEEIKKEVSFEDMMKIYKDSRVEVILRQFHYEHNLLRKYLNAWEELKHYYSNANKDEIIFDTYQDMLKVVQLQQDNENLRTTIKNDDIATNNLCNEIRQLKQGKEELIKHCENEIFSQKESIELLSNKKYADIHIGAINAYKNVLSKLKESDK